MSGPMKDVVVKRWTAKRKSALVIEIIQRAVRAIGDWIQFYNAAA